MCTKKITLIICFFTCFLASAQDTWVPPADSPGFGDSNNDAATNAPSVPIDGIAIPLIVTGLVVGFYIIKKSKRGFTKAQ